MTEKYLLFSLEDEEAKKLGEVISNPSCKKIANLLVEKEASSSDIAKELGMPLNTVEYNIEKLLGAGLIEKSKNYFWSEKGKKIDMYKVANKLIVISPKRTSVYSKLKGIAPVILISALVTGAVAWYSKMQMSNLMRQAANKLAETGQEAAITAAPAGGMGGTATAALQVAQTAWYSSPWVWFALGGIVMLIAFLLWNWKKL